MSSRKLSRHITLARTTTQGRRRGNVIYSQINIRSVAVFKGLKLQSLLLQVEPFKTTKAIPDADEEMQHLLQYFKEGKEVVLIKPSIPGNLVGFLFITLFGALRFQGAQFVI